MPPPPASGAVYDCPRESALPRVLIFDGYYTDQHHSVVNPAARQSYELAASIPDKFGHEVVNAVDAWRGSGNSAAARCAIAMLSAAAGQRAFTEARLSAHRSRQGFYVQTWLCAGLSLAYLKVEGNPEDTPAQHKQIVAWLAEIADRVRTFQNELTMRDTGDSRNNHHYWAGLAVAAAGIAADRRDLFHWGMEAGRVGLRQITAEGTLPLEMDRASMALHYHLFAAAPLVMLAELGEANGIDLYREDNGALQRLVMRAASGLADPSFFALKTGLDQKPQDLQSGATIAWAAPFARRFPSPLLSDLLARSSARGFYMIGGVPPP